MNALIHRDYLVMGSEVHIDMYDDRLEIYSPGGMYRGKPIQKCGLDEIDSVRRNPVIADLFHRMKFMKRHGNGIKKILDETAKLPGYTDELKPTFHSTHSSFFVTLKNVNYSSQSLTDRDSDQDSDHDSDHDVTKMILDFCEVARSKREICEHLGFNNLTYFTRTYLNSLLESKKLIRTIPDKPSSKNQRYIRT